MHECPQPDPPQIVELSVSLDQAGLRLDHFLAGQLEYSRSLLQDWIRAGRVLVGARQVKASTKLKIGQEILVEIPPLTAATPKADPSIPIEVIFEDEHILVLNKQRGLVVHPGIGNPDGTLVNALLAHADDWSGIRGVSKPGIVHRLDKNTSGLMVVAKHDQSHLNIQNQFKDRSVLKIYQALVWGLPHPKHGRICQPLARNPLDRIRMAVVIGGKTAISDYEVKEILSDDNALVEVQIHSGRTHQIRVHLAWLGFPIVGDPMYGRIRSSFGLMGQALHCIRLGLTHPVSGHRLDFTVPPPEDFVKAKRAMTTVSI